VDMCRGFSTNNAASYLHVLHKCRLHTSTASLMAMPRDPGESGSFSRMARPDAVRGEGEGCSVAPL
jgi:hypothetical protein